MTTVDNLKSLNKKERHREVVTVHKVIKDHELASIINKTDQVGQRWSKVVIEFRFKIKFNRFLNIIFL